MGSSGLWSGTLVVPTSVSVSAFSSPAAKTSATISSSPCPTSVSGVSSSSSSPRQRCWSRCTWPIVTIEIRGGSYRCVSAVRLVVAEETDGLISRDLTCLVLLFCPFCTFDLVLCCHVILTLALYRHASCVFLISASHICSLSYLIFLSNWWKLQHSHCIFSRKCTSSFHSVKLHRLLLYPIMPQVVPSHHVLLDRVMTCLLLVFSLRFVSCDVLLCLVLSSCHPWPFLILFHLALSHNLSYFWS